MVKYSVEFSELIHYKTVDVEADTAEEALEKVYDQIEKVKIPIQEIETAHYIVKGPNEKLEKGIIHEQNRAS